MGANTAEKNILFLNICILHVVVKMLKIKYKNNCLSFLLDSKLNPSDESAHF